MGQRTSSQRISGDDFDELLRTLSATAKGRSFLLEYRRRGRPEETGTLLDALGRIETTIAAVRDQLQPERIGGELRRIATTLEIAAAEPDSSGGGEDTSGRRALVERARSELSVLAEGLAGKSSPPSSAINLDANLGEDHLPNLGASVESRRALLRQAAEETGDASPDR